MFRRPGKREGQVRYGGPRSTVAVVVGAVAGLLLTGCGSTGDAPEPPRPTGPSPAPGPRELVLDSGGQQREYLLDVPDSYRPGEPVPLVVVLHPGRGTPRKIRSASRMDEFAQQYGALVAYPAGQRRFWRPVREGEHGIGVAFGGDPTDVDFLRELVAHLVAEWGVAPGQVYATGHSNGAAMTYRLAAEAADVFAAVAPVGGYLIDPPEVIAPAAPVSVLGVVALDAEATPEIAAGMDIWRDRLACPPGEPAWTYPDGGDDRVVRTAATCADGSEVIEYAVEGMPHVWPSPAHGLELHSVLWNFFTAHGR